MSGKQKVIKSIVNKHIKINGNNNNFGEIIGLDENAVRVMLEKAVLDICNRVDEQIQKVDEEYIKEIVKVVHNEMSCFVTDLKNEQKKSAESAKTEMNQRFDSLEKDLNNFTNGIFDKLVENYNSVKDLSKALAQMSEQSANQAKQQMNMLNDIFSIAKENNSLAKDTNEKVDDVKETVEKVNCLVNVLVGASDEEKLCKKIEADRINQEKEATYEEHITSGRYYLSVGDFDSAKEEFKLAFTAKQNGHEAHFLYNMAYYNIQPLDPEKKNGNNEDYTPICWKIDNSLNRFSGDWHFKRAIELTEDIPTVQQQYLKYSKNIEEIIFYFNKFKDKKYDCFICSKISELDENNQRIDDSTTADCDFAKELHEELAKRNLNPFFSECDIKENREILGAKYEAFILYALAYSKCMVIVCSEERYFKHSWFMQNEYNRFVVFSQEMRKENDNILLVCNNSFLPELANRQHVKMTDGSRLQKVCDYVELKVKGKKPENTIATNASKKYCVDCGKWISAAANDKFCPTHGIELMTYEEYIAYNEDQRKAEIERIREEAERKVRESERKAREEADQRAKLEQELAKKRDEELRAKEESERKAKEEAERAKLEAERKALISRDFQIDDTILTKYTGNDSDVVIPDCVTSIGNRAFYNCSKLTSVTIPDSVTSIEGEAFSGCIDLTSVTIGNNVTKIGSCAFNNCLSLTSVTIGNNVTKIGFWAFYNCSKLTSVVIPDSVTSIGEKAFSGCIDLTSVNYQGDIASWCNISFVDSYANPLRFAHNLYIDNRLVTELVIPNTITEIKPYVFYGCAHITSVTIPDSVTSIGNSAFMFYDRAGVYPKKPDKIIYNGSKEQWCAIKGRREISIDYVHFANDENQSVKLEEERKAKIARDFQIDSTVMVRYLGNDSRVIIPEGVTRIANYAFKGYEGIVKEVVLPSTLREVEKYWISAKITVNHDRIGWKYSENGRYKFVCIDKNKDFYKGNK